MWVWDSISNLVMLAPSRYCEVWDHHLFSEISTGLYILILSSALAAEDSEHIMWGPTEEIRKYSLEETTMSYTPSQLKTTFKEHSTNVSLLNQKGVLDGSLRAACLSHVGLGKERWVCLSNVGNISQIRSYKHFK